MLFLQHALFFLQLPTIYKSSVILKQKMTASRIGAKHSAALVAFPRIKLVKCLSHR